MDVTPVSDASALGRFWLVFRYVLFFAMHVAVAVGAVVSGLQAHWLALCVASFVVRYLAITVGYHRYFSHRTFRTSRAFQLVLAVLAQSANQNGVLWWAARHRHHHRYSDQPEDIHSPVQHGFLQAHLTWFMLPRAWSVDEQFVKDWLVFPELVFLQRVPFLPTMTLALVLLLTLGWEGVLWGHFLPTVLMLHATFSINSLAHIIGNRPNDTPDQSGNHWFLALITFGEGWHNNHHHRPASAAFGWHWYQVDIGYRAIWVLEKLGLVWDVKRSKEMAG